MAPAAIADETVIPLAGTWGFQLDAGDVGTKEKWFSRKLEDTVRLPGTTDENRKGILKEEKPTDRVVRVWFWKGPAWYQREVTIPETWNGIVGRMELRATDPVWIEDVQVFPNAAKKQARVRVVIGNTTGKPASGKITVSCDSYNIAKPATFANQSVDVTAPGRENVIEFTYQPGDGVPLWDEFQPALLRLGLKLETTAGGQSFADRSSVHFGMRDFTHDGHLLKNNGRTVFLRGRLDCANYPLTGYPPMDKAEWLRLLQIQKDWGLNHVRFHSWCPPAAAFEAADELGFYFQAELPNKRSAFKAPDNKQAAIHNIDWLDENSDGAGVSLYDYGKREGEGEGELILRHFGNSPSFVMFTLGNELGRNEGMAELVAHFKKVDPRHLHAQGSNNMHWEPSLAEGDDFWVTGKVENDARPLRGSFALQDFPGQGTALVGMLNDFMESKGVIEPETWREFCGVTVPLLRMAKYTWTADETLTGRLQVAHYGAETLRDASITATVTDAAGKQLGTMKFPPTTLAPGGFREIGDYSLPLGSLGISTPQRLTVTFQIDGGIDSNRYPVWIYPAKVDTQAPDGVIIANSFLAEAIQSHLASGGKVLLLPKLDKLLPE